MQFPVVLDRSSSATLTNQLCEQMRDAIRQGRLAQGIKLPSTRLLAEQLEIGRNTAVRAYEILAMEGLIESRPASGVFVRRHLLGRGQSGDHGAHPIAHGTADSGGTTGMPPPKDAVRTHAFMGQPRGKLSFDFAPCRPNANLFPMKTWRRLLQSALTQGGSIGVTHYGDLAGLVALRSAIADFLLTTRGIVADPSRILIVNGVQEGLAIVARLLVGRGCQVAVETPGYRSAVAAFAAAGADVIGVPVDEEGLQTEHLPRDTTTLLFLTPAHQFPTGAVLSKDRRAAIIRWARNTGCYIVEDDYDGDIRFEGYPAEALAAMAPDCTIHLGSFSKSLGAGLRLGYMVLPVALIESALAVKSLMNQGVSFLEQSAMAEFIHGGGYSAHLSRTRVEYRLARDRLLAALAHSFGNVAVSGGSGGLHLFWQLPPGTPDAATLEALARRNRIGICTLASANAWEASPSALGRRGIVLGFAALSPRQIDQGISRLSDVIDDTLDLQHALVHALLLDQPDGTAFKSQSKQRRALAPRRPLEPALSQRQKLKAQSRLGSGVWGATAMPVIKGLYRYPIKGLSAQSVERATIPAAKPFPFDRIFALARPGVPFDRANPGWAKKGLFIMLMLEEQLAEVETCLDIETMLLAVYKDGSQIASINLATSNGRAELERFVQGLVPTLNAPPQIVRSADGHFMDKPDNVISLINLATVRSLEQQWGIEIDPLRFRANIYIDDAAPWSEFEWIGNDIKLGDGIFSVDRRNGRCGATNVNPATGRRDLDIPGSLRKAFGHKDLGIYLVAKTDVDIAKGDHMLLPDHLKQVAPSPQPFRAPSLSSYICRGCYFIYDEDVGFEKDGFPPQTPFSAIPADWRCPDCGTGKYTFRLNLR